MMYVWPNSEPPASDPGEFACTDPELDTLYNKSILEKLAYAR